MISTGKFKSLLWVSTILVVAASSSFAQTRIARANLAAGGQRVDFTVVGSDLPVCLDLAQLDSNGSLLTFSSYYIGSLSTYKVTAPILAGRKTTSVFAISEVGSPNPVTACQAVPAAYLADPNREPKIFEQLTGGPGGDITVNQLNAAVVIQAAVCSAAPQTPGCGAVNLSSIFQINAASVNQVVVFGFEGVPFQPALGNLFTTLVANCSAPYLNSLGASFVSVCR